MHERGAVGRAKRFTARTILIVGATGGLGSAIAQAFAAEGATIALAGHSRLPEGEFPVAASVSRHQCDVANPAMLDALRDEVLAAHGQLDLVVNATGYDIRKPLWDHTADDFRRTLDVNLFGTMLLTKTFLPVVGDGMIVHLSGFADGRLAFPFYSADVASRAGIRAFSEAVNRELALSDRQARILFFSPSPAYTEAERPFHPLWREMGITITAPEKVAAELVSAIENRKQIYIMGGWTTHLFAAINAISPRLADILLMRRYGTVLRRFLDPTGRQPLDLPTRPSARWSRRLGIFMIVASFLLYGMLFSLPLLSLAGQTKLAMTPVLVGLGEATFWGGGALLGKEIVTRYRMYLDPCRWLHCFSHHTDTRHAPSD